MGSREKKNSSAHQVVENAEVKLIRLFRIGETENRFGKFLFISQGKTLV